MVLRWQAQPISPITCIQISAVCSWFCRYSLWSQVWLVVSFSRKAVRKHPSWTELDIWQGLRFRIKPLTLTVLYFNKAHTPLAGANPSSWCQEFNCSSRPLSKWNSERSKETASHLHLLKTQLSYMPHKKMQHHYLYELEPFVNLVQCFCSGCKTVLRSRQTEDGYYIAVNELPKGHSTMQGESQK